VPRRAGVRAWEGRKKWKSGMKNQWKRNPLKIQKEAWRCKMEDLDNVEGFDDDEENPNDDDSF
jgi:hypothetical protein